jgi:leucine dehydrogenase
VVLADRNAARARAVAAEHGTEIVDADAILDVPCDVLAPCALGGVLDDRTVPRLRCRAVCGAANNQLADDAIDGLLAACGVLYAPDFVANAGGIINIAEELVGYSRDRALARAEEIEQTMTSVFALARARGLPPGAAAVAMARERIETEGAGRRWRPGDPAAWTHGEPLRALRPPVAQAHR